MNQTAYLLLGLTAIVATLVAMLVFAVLRFATAARSAGRRAREQGAETAFMAAALEESLGRLREQERAMKARAEASERLSEEIIASMTSGLLVVGLDEEVRTVNPAGRRLLGLTSGATRQGRSYRALLEDVQPLADVIDECLTSGRAIVRRALPLRQTASTGAGATHLGVTVSPIRDERQTLMGAICLFTDLTEVVELEEQLRLKDSLARLGELTAGLAHEFRNGLATIHGYARLVDLSRLPEGYRPCVEGIRNETEALGQIVTNFLNFAKPAQLSLSTVDLRGLAERVAQELRNDALARGGSIEIRGTFATVEGDEVLLRQALSNLCRNALEACAAADIAPKVRIEGGVDASHQLARLSVSDNGPGVDAAARDRIFRPFFTTRAGGTGLGLALVQKIVVTHNGRISVGRADLGGARFLLALPLSIPERSA